MTSPIRLLLLEDTLLDAELMLRELKRASLDVTASRVETEDEFRQHLAEGDFDVILADYSLPTFDGASALRIAREAAPEVPFIFVSGSIGEERAVLALHDGALDYILKDRMSRLGPAVKRALEERKQSALRQAAQEALLESEVRFRSVAELAGDAILLTEGESKIAFANERAAWMFGYRAEELMGRRKISLLAEGVREEHERAMESLRAGDDSSTSLTKKTIGLRKDGREFPLEMSISSWRRHGQLFFTTILRDVSERVAAEQRQKTHFEVSRMLAASHSLTKTMPDLIRVLCEGLGWRGAALWLIDPASDRLSCAGAWVRGGGDDEAVATACLESTFPSDKGLLGRVIADCHSETVHVGHHDFDEPHRRLAAESGITRITAVPLHVTGSVIGVIEFFEGDDPQHSAATLSITAEIATQIAQYVNLIRSEEARVASAERLREAQELAHIGSWEHDAATDSVSWSEEVYAILGLDPMNAKASGAEYMAAVHPDDRDRIVALLQSQYRLGSPETIRFEHRIVRPNGQERTVECRSRVLTSNQGAVRGAIGTIQDITELTIATRTIAELSRRSQMILDCAAEGIMGINRDATISFVNPAALKLLGCSRDELLDCRDSHALIHHTKPDGSPYPLEECPALLSLQDGLQRTITGEYFWRANGDRFAVEYECAPIIEGTSVTGCVLTFRDVTVSQAMEHNLELAKRIGSLGRVAATIAHEFNNVMMGIDPFAEMIRRRAANDEKIQQAAEQISVSVRRGRRVTEEILRYTQPAAPDLQGVDLRQWLRNLAPELRALAGSAVRVVISLPESPAHVAGDAAQLQQVVTNLVVNARDASPAGGEISVALGKTGPDGVELIIRDHGSGIPPDSLEHIWEPLFTTKRTGTGLGLAVARRIVTQHGGSIDVKNMPTGGAAFRIVLPTTPMPAPAAEAHTPKQHGAERGFRRLLLVEDDDLVAEGLSTLLGLEGLAVLRIDRGSLVIDAVEGFGPDAVILDLTLPDVDGVEVFRKLRQRWPMLPVLFSTGHGGDMELAGELHRDHVELLRKPYEIGELLAALQRITSA